MRISAPQVRMIASLALCLPLATVLSDRSAAAQTLELYGTFHSMGINVEVNAADDPNGNASTQVVYWAEGSATRLTGHALSRVLPGRFSGSLFWLSPGTRYYVEVTFYDPDKGPLNLVAVRGERSTRAEITLPRPLHSYYAGPTGSGTACLVDSPCALTQAIVLAQPGDEVVLRGGVYYQGGIDLPRSGSAGAPIVIRSQPGEAAILDGSDAASFVWTSEGNGIYSTTVREPNPQVVLASGKRLFPYRSLADLRGLIYGTSGMLADGTSLRVHLSGDLNPATVPMVISRHNYAFYSEQSFIYFIGLKFRYYGCGEWGKAIFFLDASDNLVKDCTFAFNDVGVGIKYNSHRNVIEGNEFFDSVQDWSWAGVKSNSAFSVEDGGICVYEPFAGRGTVIRRNTFHDDFDGLHVSPEEGTTSSETDIYENQVYRMADDGIELDGYAANVRLWRNTFHDCLMGVSMAPCYVGPVYAIRNLIYRIGTTALSEPDGSVFKFNSGYDPSGPMFLYHNTGVAATENRNSLTLWEPGDWKVIVSRNNIWSGTAYVIANYNTSQPLDMDFDDLHTSKSGELVWWERLGDDGHLRTLAEFQSATGLEKHGISVPPGFKDSITGDYSLSPASPVVDKGIPIPGINDGYVGAAPDLGAFELGGAISPPVSQLVTNVAAGGAATAFTTGPEGALTAGYATIAMNSGAAPYGTAVFSYTQNGVIVSEAGVPASPPTTAARLFVDSRSNVNAGGGGSISVLTGLAVVNPNSTAATLNLALRDGSGALLSQGTLRLAPGEHIAKFLDQLAPGFLLPAGFVDNGFGSLEITGNQAVSVLALRLTINQRGTVLLSTTPIADLSRPAPSSALAFPQIANGGGYQTTLVLMNTSSAVETGSVQFYGDSGAPLVVGMTGGGSADSRFSYAIPAGGCLRLVTDASPADVNVGWAQLTPDAGKNTPVSAAVFGFTRGNVLVTEAGVPAVSPTTHARIYVDKSGGHDTGLAVAGTSAVRIAATAYQTDGATRAGSGQGSLDLVGMGHAAKFVGQFVPGLPDGFTGVLDLVSPSSFTALTLRSLTNNRGDFLVTTFPIADMNQPPTVAPIFPQIAAGDGYQSQIILLGASGAAATITLKYLGNDGTPVAIGRGN